MHHQPALRRNWTARAVLALALVALGGLLTACPLPATLSVLP